MVSYNRSYADSTRSISKSIFVTNFPDVTSAKELWRVCQTYGTVIDVFIPNRLSRAGKRFAFVRFIRVENVDRLVGNLCTLWIGRMHLQANVARFERPSVASPRDHTTAVRDPRPLQSKSSGSASFVSVLQGNGRPSPYISPLPAMVLDDACLVERDLENFVMGELKSFSSIPNIRVLLQKEGFQIVSLSYLGGLWVMFELKSKVSKEKLLDHVGVSSWFHQICSAQLDFVAKERIVWIDIEGVPLHAWSRATFTKICSRWESSIRSDLHLEDAGGTDCLPTATIFEELARIGRKQRKDTTVTQENTQQDDSVPTPSNDPPLSEKAKDAQAKKIADLKKRVQKLEKAKEIKNYMLKKTKESDASKQGRSIEDIDKDVDVSLVDDTQGDTIVEDSAAPITIKEITLAQTLIQIKAAKPKVVTTVATITTTTIPKARGVVVQEPSEFRTPQEPQPLMIKDKGKAIMIEPEVSLKRKDQVALDEDLARNLQAQLEAELIE
ncbi:RNA-directed DNA polymerase, eukaryota, nucleotide-binding alpha-beta plait domain protein [Tanacetum coccineum]